MKNHSPLSRKESTSRNKTKNSRYVELVFFSVVMFSVSIFVLDIILYEQFDKLHYDNRSTDLTSRQLKQGPGGGTVLELRPRRGDRPLRLYKLREFCATYAPELQNATWADESVKRFLVAREDYDAGLPSYPFLPRPVCFRHDKLFYDGAELGRRLRPRGIYTTVNFDWANLTEESLGLLQRDPSLEKLVVVPAIGLVPLGKFMVGQLYHIMNDLVAPLMTLMTRGGNRTVPQRLTELARSPTQFFTMPHRRLMWPRARMEYAVSQTKHFMGPFSYPAAPPRYFFDSAPVLDESTLYCTCQGMLIGNTGTKQPLQRERAALRLAADLMVRYMKETPYESTIDADVEVKEVGGVPVFILQRFSRVPQIARNFWTTELSVLKPRGEAGGSAAAVPAYRPRLLLVNRKRRRVHNPGELVAVAERLGFNVQVADMEEMSLEEQFHVARYADVMMGMHGMGLTHVLWMDGRHRSDCRALIELMPFGCPQKLIHFYSAFSAAVNIHYEHVEAIDMYMADANGGINATQLEKMRGLERVKKRMISCEFRWRYKGFADQIALYNVSEVEERLVAALARLKTCGIS
ncbi:Glycosyltransferase 61 [Trypanosoma melophagium]|uniref:Glycosyltransferase 61 n=1 Tax=Trypanosoma melophagium TaxID=715481 RepID=UPI00351A4A50|nr:Glycosyltransferase 61 [Trypanosoma melophagium]